MQPTVKKVLTITALVLCGTFGLQMSAQATVFNFNYASTSGTEIASGTLTTGATDPAGSFFTPSLLITGITGTYKGTAITSLLPSGTYYKTSGLFGSPGNDNILYFPASRSFLGQTTYLDIDGLGFTTASDYVNIFMGLGGYGDLYGTSLSSATSENIGTSSFTITAASTAVPEPAVLGMFGLGMLLIGGFVGLRRRVG
ncbi:MAG: PEP-CTERM sorting domain-containing protein [Terriglobia bacterium]